MTKHKTEDYKISAVKYYLNNDRGDGYKLLEIITKQEKEQDTSIYQKKDTRNQLINKVK